MNLTEILNKKPNDISDNKKKEKMKTIRQRGEFVCRKITMALRAAAAS